MTPLLSVVVPAYNADRYLTDCLHSLQNQSFRDLEFICVDDGSTDNTLRILKRFSAADDRFKILTGPNRGYGAACNRGMDASEGKYITFFESDDFCKPEFYSALLQTAERENCDFVKSDLLLYRGADDIKYKKLYPDVVYGHVFTPQTALDKVNLLEAQSSVWSAIYSTDLLQNISFLETAGAAYQDTSFAIKVMYYSKRAYFLNKAFVYYRQHDGQSIKQSGNPYAVIGEYAELERLIPMTPELFASKFHCYMWNYRRVGMDAKPDFLRRFSSEFQRLTQNYPDIAKARLFAAGELEKLSQIISDPAGFHERYGHELDYNRWK